MPPRKALAYDLGREGEVRGAGRAAEGVGLSAGEADGGRRGGGLAGDGEVEGPRGPEGDLEAWEEEGWKDGLDGFVLGHFGRHRAGAP